MANMKHDIKSSWGPTTKKGGEVAGEMTLSNGDMVLETIPDAVEVNKGSIADCDGKITKHGTDGLKTDSNGNDMTFGRISEAGAKFGTLMNIGSVEGNKKATKLNDIAMSCVDNGTRPK